MQTPVANTHCIPGGTFLMGSDNFYPEERPVHTVMVDGFWMDQCPVTNGGFGKCVESTSYKTVADRAPNQSQYPGVNPACLIPGLMVFQTPRSPVSLRDCRAWWRYNQGACWERPEGPVSDLPGRAEHPVAHIAYEDAEAYAQYTSACHSGFQCIVRGADAHHD